jgi:hypothetical protein
MGPFSVPVDRYLNYFAWDEAKHPHRRPLPEIVSIIQSVREQWILCLGQWREVF